MPYNLDTAGWAETYETLRDRVWTGFEDIAHHCEKMVVEMLSYLMV